MSKRFLNVEYSGIRTRINVTGFEDLSQVQDAIKAKFDPVMADIGAAQIQLFDKEKGQLIADLKHIPAPTAGPTDLPCNRLLAFVLRALGLALARGPLATQRLQNLCGTAQPSH